MRQVGYLQGPARPIKYHSDYKEYRSDAAVCVKTARSKNTVELVYILYIKELKYCRNFRPFTETEISTLLI